MSNAYGLEPTPEAAFKKMEKVEQDAFRNRARLVGQRDRAALRMRTEQNKVEYLNAQIRDINRSVPSFGRDIE